MVRADERTAEDRDLARQLYLICAPGRPWHALVEPVQPAGTHRCELLRARLILDHDRHAAKLLAEGGRQPVEGVEDEVLDVGVARFEGEHDRTIRREALLDGELRANPRLRCSGLRRADAHPPSAAPT